MHEISLEPEVSTMTGLQKLQCTGHLHITDAKIPKREFKVKIYGSKPVGKPREKWDDAAEIHCPYKSFFKLPRNR